VVGVLTLANVCAFVDRQILALLVVPIRRDLGLSLTEMSYLIGIPFAVFFTVLGIPIARAADSGSRRNIITVGIALWSLMTAACGLAGTFWRLLIARIGVGVGEASLQAPASSLITDYFGGERRGSALSVYQMGVFLGSGLAYLIGGWVVSLADRSAIVWPIVGELRSWQTAFFIVGLPGIIVAGLTLTVREPAREAAERSAMPVSAIVAYLRTNARALVPLLSGFTLSAAVNWGIAAFLATFLIQAHGWSAARAGAVQGVLTVAFGPLGVLAGGFLDAAFQKRGLTDGPVRVGIIGALGMLVSASAYPFAESNAAIIGWLVVVNIFAAMPWGAAVAGAAELMPASMRAQGIAIYFLGVNLVSQMLGPWAVAAVTDYVFRSDVALGLSLAIVNGAGMVGAIALLGYSLPAYRETLARRDTTPLK
jgi:MFS family permease